MVLGSAIAKRDSDTDAHNYRVTLYSVGLAEAIGVEDSEMRTLIKGSFLHDGGKIGIPDYILLKPGKLDEREFDIMKSHVTLGTEIVNRSSWLQDSVEVVGFHHERLGGVVIRMALQPTTYRGRRVFLLSSTYSTPLLQRGPIKNL